MDPTALWRLWPLPGPWRLSPLTQGANNAVYRAETPDGATYALRVYRNHADPARVSHELAIVAALQQFDLPFAVLAPIPTAAGAPVARLAAAAGENGEDALAVLWPFVPGTHPEPGDLAQAFAAGAALGQLDRALARIAPSSLPPGGPPPLGDLRRRAAGGHDPAAALQSLPLDAPTKERLLRLLRELEERVPALEAALPRQLIHADFDPSNVLLAGARVTGILDFEFAGEDLRAVDLSVPLFWWPARALGSGREWDVLDALGRGYTGQQPLARAELEALPTLLRLRALGSLLHRIGRQRQGLAAEGEVLGRAAGMLAREDWLAAHGARLLELARGWAG